MSEDTQDGSGIRGSESSGDHGPGGEFSKYDSLPQSKASGWTLGALLHVYNLWGLMVDGWLDKCFLPKWPWLIIECNFLLRPSDSPSLKFKEARLVSNIWKTLCDLVFFKPKIAQKCRWTCIVLSCIGLCVTLINQMFFKPIVLIRSVLNAVGRTQKCVFIWCFTAGRRHKMYADHCYKCR